ncbi:MAG: class A beta-lactamase [Alphaproteobacteria bacterium]|nr:class A beta-lactamase [Alphaproteobacteria bacterium]
MSSALSKPRRRRGAVSRRSLLVAPLCVGLVPRAGVAAADAVVGDGDTPRLRELEARYGGRLGVAALDLGSGRRMSYRSDERFAMCSTFKLLTAALVLTRVDRRQESLDRRVVYRQDQLVPYSPISGKHADGSGMTIGELCEAAVTLSDNTAANLLLDSFGGPVRLTAYLRSLGDPITRLDRAEPELNTAVAGDPRDTTTPLSMLEDIRRLTIGAALLPASRAQLIAWLVGCKTGDKRLRAGVPAGWRVGDKTGTGDNNTANDVGVIWPPERQPIVVVALYTQSATTDLQRDEVLASVGQMAASL